MALARELLSAFVSFLGFALDNNPPQQQTSKLPLARSFSFYFCRQCVMFRKRDCRRKVRQLYKAQQLFSNSRCLFCNKVLSAPY